jgi:hypothetical protein
MGIALSSKLKHENSATASGSPMVRRVLGRLALGSAASGLRFRGFRRWQFEASMMKATAAGNLDEIKLLVTHFKKYLVTAKVVNEAAKHGHIEILTWVHGQCHFVD